MKHCCSQRNGGYKISGCSPEKILVIHHANIAIPANTADFISPGNINIRHLAHNEMIAVYACHITASSGFWQRIAVSTQKPTISISEYLSRNSTCFPNRVLTVSNSSSSIRMTYGVSTLSSA